MRIPFTKREFLELFVIYNQGVFPMQIVFLLLGAGVLVMIYTNSRWRHWYINCIMAFLWIWMGIVYHLGLFSDINRSAYGFSVLFVLQGLIFIYYGFIKGNLRFTYRLHIKSKVGLLLIIYALAVYPLIGILVHPDLTVNSTFGLPCPTTLFTFGVLLLAEDRVNIPVYIIPFVWSLVGTLTTMNFHIYQDIALPLGTFITVFVLLNYNRKIPGELYDLSGRFN